MLPRKFNLSLAALVACALVLMFVAQGFSIQLTTGDAEAKRKAEEKDIAKAIKAVLAAEQYAKQHPLSTDLKLRSKLSIDEKNPQLPNVLARLSKTTGLKLTVADTLSSHQPSYGVWKLIDFSAFRYMELIADKGIRDGRWVKTDDGYRLEGVSLQTIPVVADSPAPSYAWLWITIAAIALAAVAAAGVYRWRFKKSG